jgi:hypothetical protein
MLLVGGERRDLVSSRGSTERRVQLTVPAWARALVVDVTMDRAQWNRFTDFGVTVFDSAGAQLAKSPLNYAFGRLQAELPEHHGPMRVEIALFPGLAEPESGEGWMVNLSTRLYADSAVALERQGGGAAPTTVAAGATAAVSFRLGDSPWPLGDAFFPLGVLVVDAGDVWTREIGLPQPAPPVMR